MPLDPYIEKYGVQVGVRRHQSRLQGLESYDGKIYGLVVDGDVLVTYYRKDLFEDPENQAAFKAKYGYDLAPPKNYTQFGDIACFLTEKYQPDIYGAGVINTGYMFFFFSERFRNDGGKFFDPETMKATVNSEAGVKALTEMVEQNKCMAPGIETWGFAENLSALNAGQIAMTISWPPLGRWTQGVNIDDEALSWVPADHGRGQGRLRHQSRRPSRARLGLHHAACRADSKNKDAAYLYIQWMHSKDAEPAERHEAGGPARPVPPVALRQPRVPGALADGAGLPAGAAGRRGARAMPTSR